jgi:CO/xanthine dehydrogenase FAD-binding subunit
MKTALSTLALRRARTLDDALAILRDEPRVPIAGATDVYVALNFGTHPARQFLDIWALDELRGIAVRDDRLVLGALTTYTDMIASPEVNGRLPMLIEAARQVGGQRFARRRFAARTRRGQRGHRAAQRRRRAEGSLHQLLYWIPRDRRATG